MEVKVYRKIIKIKVDQEIVDQLFKHRQEMNEAIIRWTKGFYKMRDTLNYQVLFHLWKENKSEIYKNQMFELLAKYHLSYDEFKDNNKKQDQEYYEAFYQMNKKIYRRFVDAVLNERSLGYFNEKTRKNSVIFLTPYNINGNSNLDLKYAMIHLDTIHIPIDLVDCILLEEYHQKAVVKSYKLQRNGLLEIELLVEGKDEVEIEYYNEKLFKERLI